MFNTTLTVSVFDKHIVIEIVHNVHDVVHYFPYVFTIRRPESACTVIIILCSVQKMSAKTPPNQNPRSKIQNPKFAQEELLHKAPKSKIQNPKSEIQNPKSEIQNSRENPKFGAVGASRKECYITIQNPKSKISEIRPKKFGLAEKVWILDWGILDFGFRILDFGGVRGM